jgi:hypothetical protein
MNRLGTLFAVVVLLAAPACRMGQPIIDRDRDPTTPGTIAGILSVSGGDPVPGRRVHAVNNATAQRYSAVTNVTGGFSIPVPPGKYHLEVDLLEGERIIRDPGVIDINRSDLDANKDIVIGS